MTWRSQLLEVIGQIFVKARLNKFTGLFGIWGKDPSHAFPVWKVKKTRSKKKKLPKKPS